MTKVSIVVLVLLLELVAFAQQQKVWTNRDLEKPIRAKQLRKVTDAEMVGIRARAYVAAPVYEAGWSYVIPWAPGQDSPQPQPLPRPSYDDAGRWYAAQPILWPYGWYPQSTVIRPGRSHRPQSGPRR